MLVIEIDHIDAEPLQARLAGGADIVGSPAHPAEASVGAAHVSELGGEEHAFPPVRDRPPDQLLVAADAVHVGGVEEVDALLDRPVNGRDRFRIVARAVKFGHAHAAEADRRNLGAVPPQPPFLNHLASSHRWPW